MASDYRPGGLMRFDFPEDTGMGATPQRLRGKSGTAPLPRPILLSAQRGIMTGGLAAGRVLEPVGHSYGFRRRRPVSGTRGARPGATWTRPRRGRPLPIWPIIERRDPGNPGSRRRY